MRREFLARQGTSSPRQPAEIAPSTPISSPHLHLEVAHREEAVNTLPVVAGHPLSTRRRAVLPARGDRNGHAPTGYGGMFRGCTAARPLRCGHSLTAGPHLPWK
jgi:hypothetical protein